MKLLSTVLIVALALAGLGLACGPEQTYCYDQHKSCEQAKLDQRKAEAEKRAEEEASRQEAGGGILDGGATVVD